jgi:hypothetical protein
MGIIFIGYPGRVVQIENINKSSIVLLFKMCGRPLLDGWGIEIRNGILLPYLLLARSMYFYFYFSAIKYRML